MAIDFRNINTVWASIATQTLKRLGLTCVVICPGSRSTPLAVAFAQQSPDIEAISILDERSAAFFALGQAKVTGRPTLLVCTSGTAGANFYPAVIEAKESRVPLLVFTTDRPPELRDCHSGQTITQVKLYGNYPNWQTELAIPSVDIGMLAYLRQMMIYAWERSQTPVPGAVHLNVPFRDPLAPIPDVEMLHTTSLQLLQSQFDTEDFFSHITSTSQSSYIPISSPLAFQEWLQFQRGIIIAGVAKPQKPQEYCRAIAQLSKTLKFPVLAEGLSPVRNYADLNPYIISTYDLILRNQEFAKQLAPEVVIQIGELPTSKELRNWLTSTQAQRWIIDNSDQNLDPLHGKTIHLRMSIEELGRWGENNSKWTASRCANKIQNGLRPAALTKLGVASSSSCEYLQLWCTAEAKVRASVDQTLATIEELFEGKAAWLLSQTLPPRTPFFIANSMPVRDVEFFWKPTHSQVQPFFNRGANGIDGTLSTALGIAHHQQSSVMLTGDLALLHDTNGFLIRNKFVGHLTIVLINNNGGGIFEMLSISKFEPPFEEFFATPQDIDFAQLCATYNVEHELITSWEQLLSRLNPLPSKGIRVLELRTNRKADAKWRKENLGKFSVDLG
ncbi:2-succinyl-5-enolpyruvyl-6-hydroxy-3-cyclohexene-1-carboxylic-acid synthase [Brasilonema sp. UFV-L1]|uniref:2-succinyl-5-enolpyruvyl-6-hydroxy-3- cyclohexene-1-carboxylic-acid synthase n=1 Tax=Brasilonema sp. UFV-L1 TaxID=2234130 RepID=UPI00145E4A3F|nr:2-succinyl-5-enolpyruvyl-6-hydroxy-3-cyclohexene-1-carboxylic-acid synthase [Brasilonema sp. UFV-L1]NMG06458.1 2-succinyl-5-enolpyruvyl-6-hydroxy-3-cyclohexene-1-carboxylic-acid synthase [Brasilonema sp. UFV-L1]